MTLDEQEMSYAYASLMHNLNHFTPLEFTKSELMALPEYSMSTPTGTVIGTVWRTEIALDGNHICWVVREWAGYNTEARDRVYWETYRVVLVDE